jgi:hypothetical protein
MLYILVASSNIPKVAESPFSRWNCGDRLHRVGLGKVGQLRAIRQVVAESNGYWLLGAEQAGPHIGVIVYALKIMFDNNSGFSVPHPISRWILSAHIQFVLTERIAYSI